ncbi:thioether cross-link-forming SCIFF peptide maturase [Paenibacillus montaniterrae]|uniref:Thioether cross-link-forming SCIFF peptide maturase n=1 Tax=Paenibacillus montaniterrae TaxID=429341 RepID=A0A920CXB4_9BACL|nr:radical SAM protein [Paenibacillus montaniterrae]GIP15128.1 thioether cross-link-forming SCIFF peptide maturase [Paenibacillus montaniterrae]
MLNSETVKVIEQFKMLEKLEEQSQNYLKQILPIGNAIVLKLTKACNLRCVYCYSCGGENNDLMKVETALKLIDQVAYANKGPISVAFHGGEPLLAKKALKSIVSAVLARPYAYRIRFIIQTNATLIDKEWADYIKKMRILTGVSLDGIQEVNDSLRYDIHGKGSFNHVIGGMNHLKENEIPFGLSTVLTRKNIDNVISILELCKEYKIRNVRFDLFLPFGYGKTHDLAPELDEYLEVNKQMIAWLVEHNKNNPDLSITESNLQGILHNCVNKNERGSMCTSSPCGAGVEHIGLGANGDVYICDLLYGEGNYNLGNINEKSLYQIWVEKKHIFERFQTPHTERVEKCSKCSINTSCFGGCPAQGISFYGEAAWSRESVLCGYYEKIIPYLYSLLDSGIAPELLGVTSKSSCRICTS